MVNYADTTPPWVSGIVKLLFALVFLTSLAYVATSSWSVASIAKDDNYPHRTVSLTCHSISIACSLLQSISCLYLMFSCTDNIRKPAYRWIAAQTVVLTLLLMLFLIPFSFDNNGPAKFHTFIEATNKHFKDKTKTWDWHSHDHAHTYAFVLHFAVVCTSTIAGGLLVRFGKRSGYQAVN